MLNFTMHLMSLFFYSKPNQYKAALSCEEQTRTQQNKAAPLPVALKFWSVLLQFLQSKRTCGRLVKVIQLLGFFRENSLMMCV